MNIKNIIKAFKGKMAQISSKNSSSRKKAVIFAVSGMTVVALVTGASLSLIHQPAYSLSFGHYVGNHNGFNHDVDDDGKLTKADAEATAKERFARMDEDEDGKLTSQEHGNYKLAAMLKLIDADANGEVTEAEFVAFVGERFSTVDTDGNGELSDEERDNAHEVMIAERHNARFKLLDTDGNGQVSQEEYEAFGEEYGRQHGRRGGNW